MNVTLRIASFGARELVRGRSLLVYTGFLVLASWLLVRFSETPDQALLSMVNVILLVVPLANLVFGAMYLYGAREFIELLLAQPVRRGQLYGGLLLGLIAPAALASLAGIALPLLVSGVRGPALATGLMMAGAAAVLSAVFAALATAIVSLVDDRTRGLALALGAWIVLAVAYDAVVLLAAVQFADYPIERPIMFAMFGNPIDLTRLVLLQQFDSAALLGYTGALFTRALGGAAGQSLAAVAVLTWVVIPALAGKRLFRLKDF